MTGVMFGDTIKDGFGFVFRDHKATFLGAFSQNGGYATPLEAEFCACMKAIEKALDLNFTSLVLEFDSLGVIKALKNSEGVPWKMAARWHNCKQILSQFIGSFSHVPKDGNMVVDALAKNGQALAMHSSQWWPSPPLFLSQLLYRDSLDLSFSRIYID